MQRKLILFLLFTIHLGFFQVNAQNNSLQEIKIKEFGVEAFVHFKDIMKDNNLFLLGEDFESELSNTEFEMTLIEYLHKNESISGVVTENGYAYCHYLNKYLQGGSEKNLELLLPQMREKDLRFYKLLRQYNDSLKSQPKLTAQGIGMDADPNLEIVYLEELIRTNSMTVPLGEAIKKAAYQVYSKYNLTDKLIEVNSYSSIEPEEINQRQLLIDFSKSNISLYKEGLSEEIFTDLKQYHHYLHLKYSLTTTSSNGNMLFYGQDIIALLHYDYILKQFPNSKFYGHIPWCNLEREQPSRDCNTFAFKALLKHKEKYKIFSALVLSSTVHDNFKWSKKFKSQILVAAKEGYKYAGFRVKNESEIDYVILTKPILFTNRKIKLAPEGPSSKHLSLYLNYGLVGYVNNDIEGVNNAINGAYQGFSGFKTKLGHKFIDLTLDYSRLVFKLSNKWTNDKPILLSITESVDFNQYSSTAYFGYNFIPHKRSMIAPLIGVGYATSVLNYMETTNMNTPPFSQFKTITYENPGIIIDYMLDINMASTTYLGLGFNIGYVTDLSSKSWINNSGTLNSTPEFSNSGFHGAFSILFNLNKSLK